MHFFTSSDKVPDHLMVQISVPQLCLWQFLTQFEISKRDYVVETKDPTKD